MGSRKGALCFVRAAGVGVDMVTDVVIEVDRKGSEVDAVRLLHEDVERGRGGRVSAADDDGRSSSDGADIPSSVCSQSICTRVEDKCVNRFDCGVLACKCRRMT